MKTIYLPLFMLISFVSFGQWSINYSSVAREGILPAVGGDLAIFAGGGDGDLSIADITNSAAVAIQYIYKNMECEYT